LPHGLEVVIKAKNVEISGDYYEDLFSWSHNELLGHWIEVSSFECCDVDWCCWWWLDERGDGDASEDTCSGETVAWVAWC